MGAGGGVSARLAHTAWADYQQRTGPSPSEGVDVTYLELGLGSINLDEGRLDSPELLTEFVIGVGEYDRSDALSLGYGARSYGSTHASLRPFVSLFGILTLNESTPGIENSGQYALRPGIGVERYLGDGWFAELVLDYELVIDTTEKLFADPADPVREFEGWGLRLGLGYRF
ncbi:MAG: hypothetical protein P1V81_12600 [Planctomycetota bacterium]|nr:hypothetical protein [Planctomycetota bacterium]